MILLTAHPVSVAASFANRGHYTVNVNPAWAITPFHENSRFKHYRGRWGAMSAFEKGLFRWLEITRYGEEFRDRFPQAATLQVNSSKMFRDPNAIERIARFVGLPARPISHAVNRNESVPWHVERRPVGNEWMRIFDMPEVVSLAQEYGFDMSEEAVRKSVGKYQVAGLMPTIRARTGYWAVREAIGRSVSSLFGPALRSAVARIASLRDNQWLVFAVWLLQSLLADGACAPLDVSFLDALGTV